MDLIRTANKNHYILDDFHQELYLCHPLVFELVNNPHKPDISKFKTSDSDLIYYKKKIEFLKSNNILAPKNLDYLHKFSSTPEHLIKKLANCNHLVFEVTEACNLSCTYCTWGKIYNIQNRAISAFNVQKALSILTEVLRLRESPLNTSSPKELTIGFYGGEPLLNFAFIRTVVCFLKKQESQVNFNFSLTTNGTIVHKYIDFIVENSFSLAISLDGDEENNSYRTFSNNRNSFHKVFENAMLIKEKYPEYFSKYVSFISVLHNRNSMDKTVKFIKKHFDKIPMVGELNPIGINSNENDEYRNIYKSYYESIDKEECVFYGTSKVETKSDGVKNFILSYNRFLIRNYNDLLHDFKISRYPTGTCTPFDKKIFFSVKNGDFLCERIGQKYDLKIFNNGKLSCDQTSKILNELFEKAFKTCKECSKNFLCKHCIFLMDISDQAKCKSFLNKAEFRYYIEELLAYFEKNPGLYNEALSTCWNI